MVNGGYADGDDAGVDVSWASFRRFLCDEVDELGRLEV